VRTVTVYHPCGFGEPESINKLKPAPIVRAFTNLFQRLNKIAKFQGVGIIANAINIFLNSSHKHLAFDYATKIGYFLLSKKRGRLMPFFS